MQYDKGDRHKQSDRQILVVTGSSCAIGAAIARAAALRGWSVCDIAGEGEGGRAVGIAADISKPGEVEAMFKRVKAEFGRVTGLVNNAATEGSQGRIGDMDAEAPRKFFEINGFGQFCAHWLPSNKCEHVLVARGAPL